MADMATSEELEKRVEELQKKAEKLTHAEAELAFEKKLLFSILDSIDGGVYVSDIDTYEVLYASPSSTDLFHEELVGGICYKEFQGLDSPCEFCTNEIILKQKPEPYRWHHHNPILDKDFAIVDRIIKWPDGRDVKLEISIDITERKQAEEERARILVLSQDLICIVGMDGFFKYVNPAWQQVLGYSSEELLTRPFLDFIHPDDHTKNDEELEKLIAGQPIIDFENRYIHRDGSIRNISWRVTPIPDEKINYCIGRDITDRKRAEEALHKSTAHLHTLIQTIPDLIWLKDPDGVYLSCNAKFERFFGAKEAEIVGKTDEDVVVRELADFFRRNDKVAMDSGEPCMNEEEVTYADDGHRELLETIKTPMYDPEGNLVGILGISRDITERKQTEEALANRERFLNRVIEQSPFAIWISDMNGTLQKANPALQKMLNLTEAQLVGVYNVLKDPVVEQQGLMPLVRSVYDKGETVHFTIQWCGEDIPEWDLKGSATVDIKATMFPIFNASNKMTNVVLLWMDVSDRKRAEEAKEKLESQLRQNQKIESLGTLAGGIAHEFNNILGIIIGNTELALSNISEPYTARSNLDEIRTASLRARDVVRQLLAFSRKTMDVLRPLRLSIVVKEALKLIRSSLPATIEIRQNISVESDTVNADPTQINQVLINLCTNASHAMQEKDGILEVNLENIVLSEKDLANYHDLSTGAYVRLSVHDTGIGMLPETLVRIFDPFFTTKEVGQGTGMGLSVVHGIVKDHGGDISVHSAPGKGTTVHVLFPVIEGMVESDKGLNEPTPRGTERILFVDDEKSIVFAAKHNLEDLNYTVITETDPMHALDIIREEPQKFDLLITDETMPMMTGDKLAKAVLAIRPEIPVILCTGYSERISEEKAQEIGISAFLMKPVVKHALAKTIRQVLDQVKNDYFFKGRRNES